MKLDEAWLGLELVLHWKAITPRMFLAPWRGKCI
jgi:hypothetical protein